MPGTFKKLLPIALAALTGGAAGAQQMPNLLPFPNASGLLETDTMKGGAIRLSGPFFQSLGTNGRSCVSCHRPAQGWSISPREVKLRFLLTRGLDPIFRTVDGSTCDHGLDTSTVEERRRAYSLLLNKGLIRIAMAVPENAEFWVTSVLNPYGCNEMDTLSVYRRPLPATNLGLLSAVMWDGRESSTETGTQPVRYGSYAADLEADLEHQALDAVLGHEQGSAPPSEEQLKAIAEFESSLATAQAYDYRAGRLNARGATGGPRTLARQTIPGFYVGINDPLGGNPRGTPFTPKIFDLFDAWVNARNGARASIARGEALFNSRPIEITGVAGLNDELHKPTIQGTCGTCHSTPNGGSHSLAAALDIGVADPDSPLDVSYLPAITLENKLTHEIKVTTDPGRALITGRWKDIGKIKGPVLRGLAGRAPYFQNGSAATLGDVLDFYNKRFHMNLTAQEKADLIAFLNSL